MLAGYHPCQVRQLSTRSDVATLAGSLLSTGGGGSATFTLPPAALDAAAAQVKVRLRLGVGLLAPRPNLDPNPKRSPTYDPIPNPSSEQGSKTSVDVVVSAFTVDPYGWHPSSVAAASAPSELILRSGPTHYPYT